MDQTMELWACIDPCMHGQSYTNESILFAIAILDRHADGRGWNKLAIPESQLTYVTNYQQQKDKYQKLLHGS